MSLETVRTCFALFIDSVKTKSQEVNVPTKDEIDTMDHYQIKQYCHLIYMRYLINNGFTIFDNSVVVHAYRHMITVINDYAKDYNLEKKYDTLRHKYYDLKDENKELKKSLENYRDSVFNALPNNDNSNTYNADKKKSWFNL